MLKSSFIDSSNETGFLEERLRLQALEARRTPIPVICIALMAAYAARNANHQWFPIFWVAIVTLLVFGRAILGNAYMKGGVSFTVMQRCWLAFSIANGVTMGGGFGIFMEWLGLEWQAMVTMFAICLIVASIPTTVMDFKLFSCFALPSAVLMAVSWLVYGVVTPAPLNWLIAALILACALVCISFVRDFERTSRTSWMMRFENSKLLSELQLNQTELLNQRDVAQQANLAKSRFLASSSHDLRQPLHTISLYNAALSLRPLDERSAWLAQQAGIAVASLSSLLNALLDVSRLDTNAIKPEFRKVSLRDLVGRLEGEFRVQAESQSLRLLVTVPPDLNLLTDPVLLERVLRNLLDNAIKHGARAAIRLFTTQNARGELTIVVHDDGLGIPQAEQQAVFEEFYQLKNPERDRSKGLGLGLTIVQRMCELLKVRCTLESMSGSTSFVLTFPFDQVSPNPPHIAAPVPSDSSKDDSRDQGTIANGKVAKRVLVLDDEQAVRLSSVAILDEWGFDAHSVASTTEALIEIKSNPPAVLIADYRLRGAATGIDFVTTNQYLLTNTLVIIVSGDTRSAIAEKAFSQGLLFLSKPVDLRRLKEALLRA